MFPGAITPVPPVNTAVRLELAPVVIVVGFAAKLVITGPDAAVTVTVAVAVTAAPEVGVTVSV
jgi:hypothetical protein